MGEDGGCTGMEARTEDRLAGSMNEQTVGSLGGGEDEWMCLDANMQTCTEKCEKNDYSDKCIVLQSHCEGKIHVSSKRGGGCCTCCIMLPRLVALCQTVQTAAIMTDL